MNEVASDILTWLLSDPQRAIGAISGIVKLCLGTLVLATWLVGQWIR